MLQMMNIVKVPATQVTGDQSESSGKKQAEVEAIELVSSDDEDGPEDQVSKARLKRRIQYLEVCTQIDIR